VLIDLAIAEAQALAAMVSGLREASQATQPTIVLLLPAGASVSPQMAIDVAVLKPVKRGELYAALTGVQSARDDQCAAVFAAPKEPRASSFGHVLLVDDHPMNLQVAQAMLQRLSLTVQTASSGEQALQYLSESDYDLVLMDEQMPGMDGLETTQQLREREGDQRHTIVVALTANADSASERRCLAAGMDGFLPKPVRRKSLREMISRWIPDLPAVEITQG
jgi:CheY-like chemotaxis protein